MPDLADLIARLEAATGPDRELDNAIARYLGWTQEPNRPWMWRSPNRTTVECFDRPRFTASLDAAVTLVPEGLHWCGFSCDPDTGEQRPRFGVGTLGTQRGHGDAATPALALCAAALRAREVGDGG